VYFVRFPILSVAVITLPSDYRHEARFRRRDAFLFCISAREEQKENAGKIEKVQARPTAFTVAAFSPIRD